jgi:hypothetical protein
MFSLLPCIFCLLYKSRKIIWMLYEKFANEGINAMDNLNIYNVEGYNMLSPGMQPLQPKVSHQKQSLQLADNMLLFVLLYQNYSKMFKYFLV